MDINTGAMYRYNGKRQRRQKQNGSGLTIDYTYAGDLLMKEERSDGTTLVYRYSAGGDIVGFTYNGAEYYYVKNLQGDVTAIANASGTVIANYVYDAWGRVQSVTALNNNASYLAVANANPIRYRGYYYDEETQWYYLGSRYYVPEWCRFLTSDAFLGANQDIHSFNLFAYCSWNPVNYSDPTGLSKDTTLSNTVNLIKTVLIIGAISQMAEDEDDLMAMVDFVRRMSLISGNDFTRFTKNLGYGLKTLMNEMWWNKTQFIGDYIDVRELVGKPLQTGDALSLIGTTSTFLVNFYHPFISDLDLDVESMRIAFDLITGPAMVAFAVESGAVISAAGYPELGIAVGFGLYFVEKHVSNMIKDAF